MRIAIVSEVYKEGCAEGGLTAVRETLVALLPAELFLLRRGCRPSGIFGAWRTAVKAENLDLRGFDLVITLGYGFAHGIIPQPKTRHLAYLFSPPLLWNDHTLAGHWYRLWGWMAAHHVEQWLANSRFVADAIARVFHKEAAVVYPPVYESEAASEAKDVTGREQGGFMAVAECFDSRALAECKEASRRSNMPMVLLSGRHWAERERRLETLERASFLVIPEAVSFSEIAVQALLLGKPILAYGRGGLREIVCEGVTGLFFEDCHAGVIADGMRRLRERFGEFKAERMRIEARRFSRARFEEEFQKFVIYDS